MRTEAEANRAIAEYSDMVWRICLCHLKNREDTEDIFQTVFLKYLLSDKPFQSPEHEKAWFIRVTLNTCKDHWKRLLRRREFPADLIANDAALQAQHREVLDALLSLPQKYRDVLYLHYYEQYSAAQIAKILKSKENTVYSLLSRGRAMLRDRLGGDAFHA